MARQDTRTGRPKLATPVGRPARIGLEARLRIAWAQARRARNVATSRMLDGVVWTHGAVVSRTLLVAPPELRTRDRSFWPEVESGALGLAGAAAELPSGSPFDVDPPTSAWLAALHGFDWLRHVEAAQDGEAETWARTVVLYWLNRERGHPPAALTPDVRARRVISWIAAGYWLLDGLEPEEYDTFTRGLGAEMLRLQAGWRQARAGEGRLTALTALTLARLAFEEDVAEITPAAGLLTAEIDRQIFADGGHVSRNPAVLVSLLLDWLPLKTCFEARGLAAPTRLLYGIEHALGMLRYLRFGDGSIARFNGMGAADPSALATLMAYDERPTPALDIATGSRYARLARGPMVVIADVGRPPPLEVAGAAHAGCLSIEVGVGRALLLVNAGHPSAPDGDWRPLARATASHSTLTLGERSSARLLRTGRIPGMMEAPPIIQQGAVEARVVHTADGVVLEAAHHGYVARCGLVHRRRIAVADGGDRLDGLDRIDAHPGAGVHEVPFAVHFHLAPETTVTTAPGGLTIRDQRLVLDLADGSRWLFEADAAGRAAIEESFAFAGAAGPRPSLQIVLRGTTTGGTAVGWSFTRLADRPAPPRLSLTSRTPPA
jgi:uncharacterized heparinase superfamily protein